MLNEDDVKNVTSWFREKKNHPLKGGGRLSETSCRVGIM